MKKVLDLKKKGLERFNPKRNGIKSRGVGSFFALN